MTNPTPARPIRTLQSSGASGQGPLAEEIAALGPWFHNLHLPTGDQTAPDHPLGDFPHFKWQQLAPALPADLTGATVLDIGCNAGFYAFELAARGAHVLGIDPDPHYLRQARWAARHIPDGSNARFEQLGVYELHRIQGRFDVVLFMGVFYHIRYPILALDLAVAKTRSLLVFQSLTLREGPARPAPRSVEFDEIDRLSEPSWPRMAFIEGELAGDATNWWVPNEGCVEALLRSAGLRIESRPGHEIFVCSNRRPP